MTLREAGVQLLDCDHRTPKTVGVGRPYVTIPQLLDGRIDLPAARRISEDDFRDWTKKTNPQAHDVVVVRRCNSGDSAFVPPGVQFALGQNLVLLRSDGRFVRPEFLRWLTRGPGWWEQVRKFINVGAVFDSLKCADIPNFEFDIPSLGEQAAISELLAALDDKIELNRRMNETLEAMARTLFKSWFVDFDPVRAKAEGRMPAGIDAATAALFPDRFEDSEIGPVPHGWHVVPLDDVARFLNGLALQRWPAVDGEPYYPVLKIAQLRAGTVAGADRASRRIPSEYVVRDGDLIFSWSGSLLVSTWAGGECALNQHLFKVTSATCPRWFVRGWLLKHLPEFQRIASGKATTMGHIQRHHLTDALVVLPDPTLLAAAETHIAPCEDLMIGNLVQTRTLADLRDTLLPKLLSGDVRVREAEDVVARAV